MTSSWLRSLSLLALLAACSSGGSSRPPLHVGDGDADADADTDADADGDADGDGLCVDYDGDGRGPLCEPGPDCNDEDPQTWEDCSTCRVGAVQEDCPCFGTEDPNACHSDELYEDPDSPPVKPS